MVGTYVTKLMTITGLLCHHHLDKLLVVDLAIPVNICLSYHLVYLLICQLLSQVGHDMSQLQARKMLQYPGHRAGGTVLCALKPILQRYIGTACKG